MTERTLYRQACWLLAERRLAAVLANGRAVAHRDRWLETTAAAIGVEHADKHIPPTLTSPDAIADHLEPPVEIVHNTIARIPNNDRWSHCRTCHGAGWIPINGSGDRVIPCPDCDKVRVAE